MLTVFQSSFSFPLSVGVDYCSFSDGCASLYPSIKQFFRTCQLGQPRVFYHSVQQYKLSLLEGLINLSTKQSFPVETVCSESVM